MAFEAVPRLRRPAAVPGAVAVVRVVRGRQRRVHQVWRRDGEVRVHGRHGRVVVFVSVPLPVLPFGPKLAFVVMAVVTVLRPVLPVAVGVPVLAVEELLLEVVVTSGLLVVTVVLLRLGRQRRRGTARLSVGDAGGGGTVGAVQRRGAEGGSRRQQRGLVGRRGRRRSPRRARGLFRERSFQHRRGIPADSLRRRLRGRRFEQTGHFRAGAGTARLVAPLFGCRRAERGGRRGRVSVADAAVGTRVAAGRGVTALRAASALVQLRRRERHQPVEAAAYFILPLVHLSGVRVLVVHIWRWEQSKNISAST